MPLPTHQSCLCALATGVGGTVLAALGLPLAHVHMCTVPRIWDSQLAACRSWQDCCRSGTSAAAASTNARCASGAEEEGGKEVC